MKKLLLTIIAFQIVACASVSRTNDLHSGMTREEVDDKLGSPDDKTGNSSGLEVRTYRLEKMSMAVQIIGGILSFGWFPFLIPGKVSYYTLFDKEGKLAVWTPSSWNVTAQTFVGSRIGSVYQTWGVPQQESNIPDGGKAYVYFRNTGSFTNSSFSGEAQTHNYSAFGRGTSSTDFTGSGTSSSYNVYCRITFFTDSVGMVAKAITEGNNCNY